jgi:hypothetical protein
VWQFAHEAAACPGECGLWQLVHVAWASTCVATNVGLLAWQLAQTFTFAANSCGA